MVLTGKTNPDLVAAIQQQGGRAIGLSGKDGGMAAAGSGPRSTTWASSARSRRCGRSCS